MADRPILGVEKVEVQDVEITPEMVEAGISCFEEFCETFPAEQLVKAIYTAMALAARQQFS